MLLGAENDPDGAIFFRFAHGWHGAREDHIAGFEARGGVVAVAVLNHFAQCWQGLLIEQHGGLFDLLAGDELLILTHPGNDARVAEQDTDSRGGEIEGGGDGVVGEAVGFEKGQAVVARRELFDGHAGSIHM